jgi:hypothetical protein
MDLASAKVGLVVSSNIQQELILWVDQSKVGMESSGGIDYN